MPDKNAIRPWPAFQSFFMAGFESATHGRRDRIQIDVISTTGHDRSASLDYSLLDSVGIRTVRDSLRWHLIEASPGTYDWTSLIPMLKAASYNGIQVIWDLCHWGYPSDLDLFSSQFPERFAAFAAAADTVIQQHKDNFGDSSPSIYCPINEISFWAWVGGDEEHFRPYGSSRGPELKLQLAAASIAAMRAIRSQNPQARFVQAEPIINISAELEDDVAGAAKHTASQFEAWDMLAGKINPELGGSPETLDLIGVNYYWNNQWIHEGDRTPPGHEQHKPLHQMIYELWKRYERPIIITETGTECGSEYGWLGYVTSEARQAHRLGVPLLGICIYPVMDYPGWDDERHCHCGLIQVADDWSARTLRVDLSDEVKLQEELFQRSIISMIAAPSDGHEVERHSIDPVSASK